MHQKDQKTLALLHEKQTKNVLKKANPYYSVTAHLSAPADPLTRGRKFGGGGGSEPPFERAPRRPSLPRPRPILPSRPIRRLRTHLPRRRPLLPATPASSPSPFLFLFKLPPLPPSVVSWPCIYNNSITCVLTSSSYPPSLYSSPRSSVLIQSLSRPVPLENPPGGRRGLQSKVGHGRSSPSPSPPSSVSSVQML